MIRLVKKFFLLVLGLAIFATGVSEIRETGFSGSALLYIVIGIACTIGSFKAFKNPDKVFNDTISQIQQAGYKITYANRGTGTISYRDNNNEVRSISVYRGYNSHKR